MAIVVEIVKPDITKEENENRLRDLERIISNILKKNVTIKTAN